MPPPNALPAPKLTSVKVQVDPDDGGAPNPHSVEASVKARLTLIWESTDATAVRIDGLGTFGASDKTALPTKKADYVLTATAKDGRTSAPWPLQVHTHADGDVVSQHADVGLGSGAAPVETNDLFIDGFDFKHRPPNGSGTPARLWAHPGTKGNKVPLLIWLHGNNKGLQQAAPALNKARPGSKEGAAGLIHAGRLLTPEIDKNKVVPLVIASPWVFNNNKADEGNLWAADQFDLSTFVGEVQALLAGFDEKVEIDLDCVAITGHSGAGGSASKGLSRVAEGLGTFTVDGQRHDLTLFGVMDTATNLDFGGVLKWGPGGRKIDIYTVHRPMGGWVEKDAHAQFSKGLGATDEFTWGSFEAESGVHGTDPSFINAEKRITSIEIALDPSDGAIAAAKKANKPALTKPWDAYRPDWTATGGYQEYTGWGNHFDTCVAWTFFAARRFFAPGACDARNTARASALHAVCDSCDAIQKLIDDGTVASKLKVNGKTKGDPAIEALQFLLVQFGYINVNGLDGNYGKGTTAALKQLIKELGAPPDGKSWGDGASVGPDLAAAMLEKHKADFFTATAK